MSKIILTSTLFKLISRLMLLACVGVLFGCSKPHDPKDYMKTFDHILTDQYIETPGHGGIYWVSNEQLVLEARVKNDQGALDRGIYQIDVRDGSYLKVVDIPDQGPITYKFCFDGKVLHVTSASSDIKVVNASAGYEVDIRELEKITRTNAYSPLRCNFVEKPNKDAGYGALRLGDGFIKHQWEGTEEVHVFLADAGGNELKKLVDQKVVRRGSPVGMFTLRYYLEEKNAYFGYSPWDRRTCTELWWLYRDGWTVKNEELCLPELKYGSLLVHNLKDALYLEHYTSKSAKTYILKDTKKLLVERRFGRGASVSPDQCLIAYGEGDRGGTSGVRQKLKIFNYCEYQQREY